MSTRTPPQRALAPYPGPRAPTPALRASTPAPSPANGATSGIAELTRALVSLTQAHRDLCGVLDTQHGAMKRFDTAAMADGLRRQESIGRRILRLEQDRRRWVAALARTAGIAPDATLAQLADAHPQHRQELLSLRAELRRTGTTAAAKSHTSGRIASSVLAGLNGALRLITDATTYRRSGAFDAPLPRSRVEAIA